MSLAIIAIKVTTNDYLVCHSLLYHQHIVSIWNPLRRALLSIGIPLCHIIDEFDSVSLTEF